MLEYDDGAVVRHVRAVEGEVVAAVGKPFASVERAQTFSGADERAAAGRGGAREVEAVEEEEEDEVALRAVTSGRSLRHHSTKIDITCSQVVQAQRFWCQSTAKHNAHKMLGTHF